MYDPTEVTENYHILTFLTRWRVKGDVQACCFMEEGVKLLIQINLFF